MSRTPRPVTALRAAGTWMWERAVWPLRVLYAVGSVAFPVLVFQVAGGDLDAVQAWHLAAVHGGPLRPPTPLLVAVVATAAMVALFAVGDLERAAAHRRSLMQLDRMIEERAAQRARVQAAEARPDGVFPEGSTGNK